MAGATEIVSNTPMGETLKDLWRMALYFSASKLFAFKTPEEAMAMMLIAHAEGRHPALAVRDYHIIQNRPALKSEAMLARFQQAGGIVKWSSHTDEKVAALFAHPQACPEGVEVEWDVARATKAKLINKDNWVNYRRAMLRARTISEGVRAAYPACICGFYSPEELEDSPAIKAADFSVPDEKPVSKTESLKNRLAHKPVETVQEQIEDASPPAEPVTAHAESQAAARAKLEAPAERKPEPAPVVEGPIEPDVLTRDEKLFVRMLGKKRCTSKVGDMNDSDMQDARDAAEATLHDPEASRAEKAHAAGSIVLLEAEAVARAGKA